MECFVTRVFRISRYPLFFVFIILTSYDVTLRLMREKPLLSDLFSSAILVLFLVASTILLVAIVVWKYDQSHK